MISQELEVSLHMAFVEARSARHEFITVEHLLLSLLDNASAVEVLRACAANLDDLRRNLRQFVSENTPVIPSGAEVDTQPTLGFQRVIQRAIMHVSAGETRHGRQLLVAIFGEKDSHAVYYLQQQGVTRLDVVNFLSHGITKQPQVESAAVQKEQQSNGEDQGESRQSPLDQYANDLNAAALAGRIDPLIGREHEVERVIQVLCRRRKNNPLLVGEAGVGKTAIAEGLAWRITRGEVPEILQASQVYALDMGALLAGTKYRGDFEQRLKGVLKQIRGNPDAILFIDEIHTLIGAGSASGGTLDASNLLKPALSSGQLKCIGATTYTEYRGVFEKDHALSRRFQKIDVPEPSVEQTVQILRGLKSRFEEHHNVRYSSAALSAAAELSARYINDRHLPDKAIDVIDEAGAAQRAAAALAPEEGDRQGRHRKHRFQDRAHSAAVRLQRRPQQARHAGPRPQDRGVRPGQRHRGAVGRHQDGALRAAEKPIGAFLFSGPTGVEDRGRASAGLHAGRGAAALRHVGIHGAPCRVAPDRRAAGIRGLRSGPADRGHHKQPHCVLLLDEIERTRMSSTSCR